jgi:uncharacterized protein (DUF1015 family)
VPLLRPFRALRYDPRAVRDLGAVVCPPYDIISAADREQLAAQHSRNAVHLELPRSYTEAVRLFDSWQTDGTLRRDPQASIYIYEQTYQLGERRRTARGFYCRLRLEPLGARGGVRAHERTLAAPKEDRYQLMKAVHANLSPIVLLYEEPAASGDSAGLLDRLTSARPAAEAVDTAGVRHRLWAVDPLASGDADSLLRLAASGPLTIADGHHRYETALRFRDEHRPSAMADASPIDDVLALLYEARSGGLTVLPTHRVVGGGVDINRLLAAAADLFTVTTSQDGEWIQAQLAGPQLPAAAFGSGRLGLWSRAGGALLEVDRSAIEGLLPPGASDALRTLDLSVLSVALERLVGATASDLAASGRMVYTKDARHAMALVDGGQADACFLLPATPVEAVLAVAAAGEVMPEKSTYFHPKAATGLVFNPLAD